MSRDCPLCIDWDALRALGQGIDTPIGHYPAGTPVLVLSVDDQEARICLDLHGHHLIGRCHSATVRLGWLDPVDQPRGESSAVKV